MGISEELTGFRYVEIGSFFRRTQPALRNGSSVAIPFAGAISYCRLKSPLSPADYCSTVPREQILEFHACSADHATMVFTKR